MLRGNATGWLMRWLLAYLLNEIDGRFEIHAEIDELPLDSFLLVLLLLEDEHVVVEELLQTLVGVVDAQLLERVVLISHISISSTIDVLMAARIAFQLISAKVIRWCTSKEE